AALAFAGGSWARAAQLFERVLARARGNLMAAVQLAACRSFLGREREALEAFELARRIDPRSIEVRHYLGLHHLKYGQVDRAGPLLEAVLASQPDRLAAMEGLAQVRVRQGRLAEAAALLERAVPLSGDPGTRLVEAGLLRMRLGETAPALAALERARGLQGIAFRRDLELGVLFLAAGRLEEARDALDRVPRSHPDAPMALFKRAQVSVLLGEADRQERVRAARAGADATTRRLIEGERLFEGLLP
ncbi:MAG TPA: tetratricopeptide repeat protein, partial [Thermoanaerobaculia bacterium]|nr:tetratricopeptide repeat protein [Thermoanaerobaculia bacterium]